MSSRVTGPPDVVAPNGEQFWFSGDEKETVIRAIVPAHYPGPPLHLQTDTEEHPTVIRGRLRYYLDGMVHELGPGESIRIPRLAKHRFENPYGEEAEIENHATPGLVHEVLLRLLAGATSKRPPNPLEVAVAFHDGDSYPAQPPLWLSRSLVNAVCWISEKSGVAGRFRAAHLPNRLLARR